MSIVEVDSRTNLPIKETTFNYNEYVDQNGVVLVGKYHGLLNELVGRVVQ